MESVHATVLKNRGVEGQELAWLETHKRGKSGCVECKLGKKVSVPIVCVSARHELPQVIYVSFSHFHSDLSTAGEREGPLLPGEWLTPTANVSNGFLPARRTLLGASRTRLSNMPLRREMSACCSTRVIALSTPLRAECVGTGCSDDSEILQMYTTDAVPDCCVSAAKCRAS